VPLSIVHKGTDHWFQRGSKIFYREPGSGFPARLAMQPDRLAGSFKARNTLR